MSWTYLCSCRGEVASGGKAPPGGGECLSCGRVYDGPAQIVAAGGSAMHICTRGRRKREEKCQVEACTNDYVALCDEPTGHHRTCDQRVCSAHRTRVGNNRDRCPAHAGGAA